MKPNTPSTTVIVTGTAFLAIILGCSSDKKAPSYYRFRDASNGENDTWLKADTVGFQRENDAGSIFDSFVPIGDEAGETKIDSRVSVDTGTFSPPDLEDIDIEAFDSKLDPEAILSELEGSTIDTLCMDMMEYQRGAIPFQKAATGVCVMMYLITAAFTQTIDVDSCRSMVDSCLLDVETYNNCGLETGKLDSSCLATVADYEACITESTALTLWLVDTLDCQMLEGISYDDLPSNNVFLSAMTCESLRDKCPEFDLLGDVESSCTYGMDQTCNDNPAISSLHGKCNQDGSCTCYPEFDKNLDTGKCL